VTISCCCPTLTLCLIMIFIVVNIGQDYYKNSCDEKYYHAHVYNVSPVLPRFLEFVCDNKVTVYSFYLRLVLGTHIITQNLGKIPKYPEVVHKCTLHYPVVNF